MVLVHSQKIKHRRFPPRYRVAVPGAVYVALSNKDASKQTEIASHGTAFGLLEAGGMTKQAFEWIEWCT